MWVIERAKDAHKKLSDFLDETINFLVYNLNENTYSPEEPIGATGAKIENFGQKSVLRSSKLNYFQDFRGRAAPYPPS